MPQKPPLERVSASHNGVHIGSPVLMAAKAELRNGRPVVLAITSNDILGLNARNLGTLLITKNVYFVPFGHPKPMVRKPLRWCLPSPPGVTGAGDCRLAIARAPGCPRKNFSQVDGRSDRPRSRSTAKSLGMVATSQVLCQCLP